MLLLVVNARSYNFHVLHGYSEAQSIHCGEGGRGECPPQCIDLAPYEHLLGTSIGLEDVY